MRVLQSLLDIHVRRRCQVIVTVPTLQVDAIEISPVCTKSARAPPGLSSPFSTDPRV